MQFFTDGSKDPVSGKTGFGMYSMWLIFRSNRAACLFLLSYWLFNGPCGVERVKPSKSIICSDFVADLLALRDGTSKASPDLLLEILCCLFSSENMGCPVSLLWVPGHSVIEGNEIG